MGALTKDLFDSLVLRHNWVRGHFENTDIPCVFDILELQARSGAPPEVEVLLYESGRYLWLSIETLIRIPSDKRLEAFEIFNQSMPCFRLNEYGFVEAFGYWYIPEPLSGENFEDVTAIINDLLNELEKTILPLLCYTEAEGVIMASSEDRSLYLQEPANQLTL